MDLNLKGLQADCQFDSTGCILGLYIFSRETSTNDQDLKDVLDSKEDVEVTTVDFGEIQLGGSDVQRMCIRLAPFITRQLKH